MKNTHCILLVLILSTLVAFTSDSLIVGPGTSNSYDVVQAPVLKVYTAKDGQHRFVAYLVKWKGAEVIVSDPLSQSAYKVGDTIWFLAQKISVDRKDSTKIDSLAFTLAHPNDKR